MPFDADTGESESAPPQARFIGHSVERVEDAALLRGSAAFMDDLPTPVSVLHAAFVRSPHAHAEIIAIDDSAARDLDGIHSVITGEDLLRFSKPFTFINVISASYTGSGYKSNSVLKILSILGSGLIKFMQFVLLF